MNKNELIDRISEKAGLTKNDANKALDAITDTIAETMKAGDNVVLVGFGSFEIGVRKARTGRHPRTGETMQIPEKKIIRFKVGKKLKDSVGG